MEGFSHQKEQRGSKGGEQAWIAGIRGESLPPLPFDEIVFPDPATPYEGDTRFMDVTNENNKVESVEGDMPALHLIDLSSYEKSPPAMTDAEIVEQYRELVIRFNATDDLLDRAVLKAQMDELRAMEKRLKQ